METKLNQSDITELKEILKELPHMRWNISEESGYFGDEWDNWQHEDEEDLEKYFCQMFDTIKKLKDKIEKL